MAIESFVTGTEEYGHWMKMLVVGVPGSGKTLMASTFPNVYYACSEPGLMSVASLGVRGTRITDTKQLTELAMLLEQPRDIRSGLVGVDGPIDTLVLDTIDEIQQVYINERLRDEKISALRIQDYGWLGDQMKSMLRRFRNLDMHVIWNCHETKDQDKENDRIIYEPGLVGKISEWVPGAVDLSLSLTARSRPQVVGDKTEIVTYRKLQTYPDAQHPWVKDRSGKLPPEVDINFQDDYARISHAIFEKVPEMPDFVPAEMPEPVQKAPQQRFTNQCSDCGEGIPDGQAAISKIKYRTPLCEEHYDVRENDKEKVS